MINPIMKLLLLVLLACRFVGSAQADTSPLDRAEARIERIRMADVAVIVKDRRGRRVRDAEVRVEQTRHAFLFGAAALSLLKHTDMSREVEYQQRFRGLFNYATVLTYWQDTNPSPDREDLTLLTAQAQRLHAMGIRVKGHPLLLAGACPAWVPQDPAVVQEHTRKRIGSIVSRFAREIDVWDVVGDATTASGAQTGLGAWSRSAGPAAMTTAAFVAARKANAHAALVYNDYKLDEDFAKLIRALGETSAPVDVLGLEAHMIGSEWTLQRVWDTAETFAALGKPLHFSEVTVLSDDPKADHTAAWPSTPQGEARQADYVEKLYTLLFSHPAVQGIGWWTFVDGDWDRYPAGLLRADLSPKPAYERLHALIKRRWWTDAVVKTDRRGEAHLRGFLGGYRITVKSHALIKSVSATITSSPNRIEVQM